MSLTLQDIGIGASANDGSGDTPRATGQKINANNAAIVAFLKALANLDTVGTAQIDNGAVTLAKMADMADGRILGNNAGIAGPPIALTASQVKTLLAMSVGDLSAVGAGTLLGNNGGVSAAPSALSASQVKTLLAISASDVSGLTALRLDQFATPTADVAWGGYKVTGLGDPTGGQDAATKNYVDTVAQGLDAKASVKVATTANITLSGEQTIDDVAVTTGDRVLVKNQSTASQNGIYVVASGSWARATDMDAWAEFPGGYTWVEHGTTNGDTGWVCTNDVGGTLGSTSVTFTQFAGAGSYTATGGITLTGTQFSLSSIADQRIMGNVSGSSAAPIALTASQIKTMLAIAWSDVSSTPTTFTGYGFTGAQTLALGTVNGTGLSITQDATGTGTYTFLKFNLTGDTGPSNAASLLFDMQYASSSMFSIRRDGAISISGPSSGAAKIFGTAQFRLGSILIGQEGNGGAAFADGSGGTIYGGIDSRGLTIAGGYIGFAVTHASALDTMISRAAAATIQHGAADAASPVAQTVRFQSVVAGTSNTAGANATIQGSAGTGTGNGGSLIFQVAPAGSNGTSRNPWATALTIDSTKLLTLGGNINNAATWELQRAGTTAIQFQSGRTFMGVTVSVAGSAQLTFSDGADYNRGFTNVPGVKAVKVTDGSTGGGALQFQEMTAPSAPSTNLVYLYAQDNGSGKTQLMALFPTGAAQQVAIEP